MDKFSRFTFTFLATLAFVNFSFPVSAQEDTVEIEEVIVEATRRAESIQDIALSVQACQMKILPMPRLLMYQT